ncbi:hypothetical protein HAX54_025896, partial [Datura stramonium]|nr:hypothetical protein [Datura stramonium]
GTLLKRIYNRKFFYILFYSNKEGDELSSRSIVAQKLCSGGLVTNLGVMEEERREVWWRRLQPMERREEGEVLRWRLLQRWLQLVIVGKNGERGRRGEKRVCAARRFSGRPVAFR